MSHPGHLPLSLKIVVLLVAAGILPSVTHADLLSLEPCGRQVRVADAECGTLEVWEVREAGAGRTVPLNIVVLPALGRDRRPDPVFVLAGGPGQAATDLSDLVDSFMRRIRERRDIVLVDQRGTGESGRLDCDFVDADSTVYQPDSSFVEPLRRCLEGYDADVRHYTTPVAMDDLDDVRQALGYDRVNLWGGSYGSRAALVYLRRHGEHVRSVIVDGLAPPAIRLPVNMGVDGYRALQLAVDDCAADPACTEAFGDVRAKLDELLSRLDREPESITIQHPRTGELTEQTVTRDAVAFLLRGALYSAELSQLLPLVIDRAHQGDFGPMAAMADPWGEIDKAMSIGMFFSVICSEDLSQVDEADRQQLLAEPFLGDTALELYGEVCGFWPRGELPAGYHDPVASDIPVLVLSGELDPVTPPRWGDLVARHLSRGRHVVVPGVAHMALPYGCVPRLMAQFLDDGSADSLDVSCVEKLSRPPFFSSFTGPAPSGDEPDVDTAPLAESPADSGGAAPAEPPLPKADGGTR